MPPASVIGASAVMLFVARIGITVLVGGVAATPQWVRTSVDVPWMCGS